MTLTIKTLPHYFPEVFAQRVILSVLVFLALCVVIVLLYKCLKIDKCVDYPIAVCCCSVVFHGYRAVLP